MDQPSFCRRHGIMRNSWTSPITDEELEKYLTVDVIPCWKLKFLIDCTNVDLFDRLCTHLAKQTALTHISLQLSNVTHEVKQSLKRLLETSRSINSVALFMPILLTSRFKKMNWGLPVKTVVEARSRVIKLKVDVPEYFHWVKLCDGLVNSKIECLDIRGARAGFFDLFMRNPLPHLRSLVITFPKLSAKDYKIFTRRAAEVLPNLGLLDLTSQKRDGSEQVIEYLATNPSVRIFLLSAGRQRRSGINLLPLNKMLIQNTRLRLFSIKDCRLTADTIANLATGMAQNAFIKKLIIRDVVSHAGELDLSPLFEALKDNVALTSLVVYNAQHPILWANPTTALVTMIQHIKKLRDLVLNKVPCVHVPIIKAVSASTTINKFLLQNERIVADLTDEIVENFTQNTTLKHLDLRASCHALVLPKVFNWIATNTTLTTLHLHGMQGLEVLLEAASHNHTLYELNFGFGRRNPMNVFAATRLIQASTNISRLGLNGIFMGDDDLTCLVDALADNYKITYFHANINEREHPELYARCKSYVDRNAIAKLSLYTSCLNSLKKQYRYNTLFDD